MIEFAGMQLGTVFQGGTLLALLAVLGAWYIRGMPDRARVRNEGMVITNAETARQYSEWRKEIHDLKNEVMVLAGKQVECIKALVEAHGINRHNEAQMSSMVFLIGVLIKEMDRVSPHNVVAQQAKITLEHFGHAILDPDKSTALAAAEETVKVAKTAVEEVKHAEEK